MKSEQIFESSKNEIPDGWDMIMEKPRGGLQSEKDTDFGDDYYESLDRRQHELFFMPLPEKILEKYLFIRELPEGIGVMGGMARSIAREVITGETEPIRDIDLVDILDERGESKTTWEVRDMLAAKYMPDDYSFGHGINNEDLEHYFNTRDFTVNQSLILDGKLIVSDLAYSDFQENIVRPTEYEVDNDGCVRSRIFMKALMMRTVLLEISESIPLLEDCECEEIHLFDVALTLNKMMSRGAETARRFTKDLAEWGIIDEDLAGKPKHLAAHLLEDVEFTFRPTNNMEEQDDDFKDVREFFEDYDHEERLLAQYSGNNSWMGQMRADYFGEEPRNGDFSQEIGNELRELKYGKYRQVDYDEINKFGINGE